jgi:murein DD-endopeptidase MepM/ murein hydrolase activator NlpD
VLEAALRRPPNYSDLSAEDQWAIDRRLGILDWDPTPAEVEEYNRHRAAWRLWLTFPIPRGASQSLPAAGSGGEFGAIRKHDIHTGVDLYCPEGTEVVAVEAGVVVAVVPFTGPATDPPSPWWNATDAVLIENRDEVLCYGEIQSVVAVGDKVEAGQIIGKVGQVLKNDKGRPMSMLHFEMYEPGTREPVWWQHGEPTPTNLIDPTPLLHSLLDGP